MYVYVKSYLFTSNNSSYADTTDNCFLKIYYLGNIFGDQMHKYVPFLVQTFSRKVEMTS